MSLENFVPRICVMYHAKDSDNFRRSEACEQLRSLPYVTLVLSHHEAEHQLVFRTLSETISRCDIVLLYRSEAPAEWALMMMHEIRRIRAGAKAKRKHRRGGFTPSAFIVCEGGRRDESLGARFRDVIVIRDEDAKSIGQRLNSKTHRPANERPSSSGGNVMTLSEAAAPTTDKPLLVGLLVDVSGSMRDSINNASGESLNRLQGFEKALEDLAAKAKAMSTKRGAGLVRIFAYGFGFNNPVSVFLRGRGPNVRDLLSSSSTVSLDQLSENWSDYQSRVKDLAIEMFGSTPMGEGFRVVRERFSKELRTRSYSDSPVLFVLSDGEPTDAKADEILRQAETLKQEGVTIISCFVTNKNIAEPRRLYGEPRHDWPGEAKLMFGCSSTLPPESTFEEYMREYGWSLEENGRLFTQINQSEILSEFLNVILSPVEKSVQRALSGAGSVRDRVFISYSHADSVWLERLRVHLKPLERAGVVDAWDDTKIRAGGIWAEEIKSGIERAKVVLLLVSADFMASDFIQERELPMLLNAAEDEGATIIPVILSPSRFSQDQSLSRFQSVNPPSQPLTSLSENDREQVFVKVTQAVEMALSQASPADRSRP